MITAIEGDKWRRENKRTVIGKKWREALMSRSEKEREGKKKRIGR